MPVDLNDPFDLSFDSSAVAPDDPRADDPGPGADGAAELDPVPLDPGVVAAIGPGAATRVGPSDDDPGNDDDDAHDHDLVRAALARARGVSRTRPSRRRTRRPSPSDSETGRRGGYSSAGPDAGRDPLALGQVFSGHVDDLGWQRPLAQARVFADWAALVGPDVAAHCTPQSLREGELRVTAESTAWATQLRLLSSTMLARLVDELGPHVVTKLSIAGPSGPSWKHGRWTVRGARGPRDTYG